MNRSKRRLTAALPLLVALALAGPARASGAVPDAAALPQPEGTPDPALTAPAPTAGGAAGGGAAEGSPEPPERWGVAKTAGAILLLEGVIAGYSGLAAYHPEPVGLVQVITSPLAAMSSKNVATFAATAGGFAALGLYNAIELRKAGYSRSDRFWRNFAGWHAIGVVAWGADALFGGDEPAAERDRRAALTVGFAGDAPLLLFAGMF